MVDGTVHGHRRTAGQVAEAPQAVKLVHMPWFAIELDMIVAGPYGPVPRRELPPQTYPPYTMVGVWEPELHDALAALTMGGFHYEVIEVT